MTEIIIGERGSGKTTELIKRSAETGSYILVATKMMAKCIHLSALDMGASYSISNNNKGIFNRRS